MTAPRFLVANLKLWPLAKNGGPTPAARAYYRPALQSIKAPLLMVWPWTRRFKACPAPVGKVDIGAYEVQAAR